MKLRNQSIITYGYDRGIIKLHSPLKGSGLLLTHVVVLEGG